VGDHNAHTKLSYLPAIVADMNFFAFAFG